MTRPRIADRPVDRRTLLRHLAALGFVVTPVAGGLTACGMGGGRQPAMGGGTSGGGMSGGGMPGWMMSDGMMDADMMSDMPTIHDLLVGHDRIRREVTDIDAGIRSRTTSGDPRLVELIRAHVAAMRRRIEEGRPIRQMDPLFREIFKHHDATSINLAELPDGVQVTETSGDAQVRLLIRQHARRAVSEFVAAGMPRAMQPTPLPDGYRG